MRQVGDTLVWLAMIGVVAAVVYFTPRLANYVGSMADDHTSDKATFERDRLPATMTCPRRLAHETARRIQTRRIARADWPAAWGESRSIENQRRPHDDACRGGESHRVASADSDTRDDAASLFGTSSIVASRRSTLQERNRVGGPLEDVVDLVG